MAVICRRCGSNKEISLPPVRTRNAPCDICGESDDPTGRGRNYDYPDNLMPGHRLEPNAVAEREEAAK